MDAKNNLSPRGKVMVWVQEAIRKGELSPGSLLPAERSLAVELGVSRTTVRAALAELEGAGTIENPAGGRIRRVANPVRIRPTREKAEKNLFGTDGIRGRANTYPILPETALQLGKAIAHVCGASGHGSRRTIIGKDTRLSGYMLETALTSGLVSMGMDVFLVGPVPTPAVAHLTRSIGAEVGIMLTASHNPFDDNGIKLFDKQGFKLSDDLEAEIEKRIGDAALSSEHIRSDQIGKAYRIDDAQGRYIEFAKSTIRDTRLDGIKVALDCANGAAYFIAPLIFKELGATLFKTAVEPDGYNINNRCGALFPENVAKLVREHQADVGIALDGDADRVIFCDADGNIVDGDRILAMLAIDYRERQRLKDDTLVVTTMSNLGLHVCMKNRGIKVVTTDVGDRQVIECMRAHGYTLGGEQSGHLIFMDHATTGDGIVSALQVLKLMRQTGQSLAQLASCMKEYPQKLVNVTVREKRPLEELKAFQRVLYQCERELGESGRTLVRYSGTENKLRILVESADRETTDRWAGLLADAVKREIGS